MGSSGEDDGMGRLEPPVGYSLGKGQRMQDVLELEAELLESEGLDPRWPGFGSTEPPDDDGQ